MELEKNTGVSMTKTGRVIGRIVSSKPECLHLGLPRGQLGRMHQHVDIGHGPRGGMRIEPPAKGCAFEQA